MAAFVRKGGDLGFQCALIVPWSQTLCLGCTNFDIVESRSSRKDMRISLHFNLLSSSHWHLS